MIGQWSALSLQPKDFQAMAAAGPLRQGGGSMSLRKRPTVTPAQLEANRANARKSTGPRTVEGKNRIVLNALKDSCHARHFSQSLCDQVHAAFRLHGWR